MGNIKSRLGQLEALAGGVEETGAEREERRRMIREASEGANNRARRDGRVPPFEIADTGDVWCTHDRRPVSTFRQTLAEPWYWEEVEAGFGHLVHDAKEEAFYTHSGHLAISRDVVDLRYLIPARP
ncbi:MAG: hypothetical protein M3518_01335 [Actinomycetota bacterium]|nr:hypothetical protein [Actinomycetota bacterium]